MTISPLQIVGGIFLLSIVLLIPTYLLSRAIMRAWLHEFDRYINSKLKNYEQEEKEN